jgi:hypothetical protein
MDYLEQDVSFQDLSDKCSTTGCFVLKVMEVVYSSNTDVILCTVILIKAILLHTDLKFPLVDFCVYKR